MYHHISLATFALVANNSLLVYLMKHSYHQKNVHPKLLYTTFAGPGKPYSCWHGLHTSKTYLYSICWPRKTLFMLAWPSYIQNLFIEDFLAQANLLDAGMAFIHP
jgi:hypothetical protein